MEWIRRNIIDKLPSCNNCGFPNILNRIKGIYCCKKCISISPRCGSFCDEKHQCKIYEISNWFENLSDLFIELYKLQKK